MRAQMREKLIFEGGESYKVPSTIDDPAILAEIEDAVAGMGYGKK